MFGCCIWVDIAWADSGVHWCRDGERVIEVARPTTIDVMKFLHVN
jgi:hypothetical protein